MARKLHALALVTALSLYQGHARAACPVSPEEKKSSFNQLLEKIRHGDIQPAEDAVKKGMSPNLRNGCGAGFLLVAATTNRLDLIEFLITKHADLNAGNWEGATPLSAASMVGNADAVQLLLKNGADPNIAFTRPEAVLGTPLLLAAANNHEDLVDMLLKHGADPCWKSYQGDSTAKLVDRDAKIKASIRAQIDAAAKKQCRE